MTGEIRNLAWAAGLFEGEGCITMNKLNKQKKLSLGTTDEDICQKFASIVKIGHIYGPRNIVIRDVLFKPVWEWVCSSPNDARQLLSLFRPYLGQRRLKRAREVFGDF